MFSSIKVNSQNNKQSRITVAFILLHSSDKIFNLFLITMVSIGRNTIDLSYSYRLLISVNCSIVLQSSNVENKNISNSNTAGIPIVGDGTAVLNYSSMGSDPKTFNFTNTASAGTVLWQASFTGTSGTGSPAVFSLQPSTMFIRAFPFLD